MKTLVANWKMNILYDDFKKYFNFFLSNNIKKDKKIIFCLPYIFLHDAVIFTNDYPEIKIFAQNCHYEKFGAFTGEISCKMLKSIGVSGSIIGHSERRLLGETSDLINKKLKSLLNEKMSAIFCIGEKLYERNIVKKVIENQIFYGLNGIKNIENVIFAYEPVWSIGSNNKVQTENIEKVSEIVSNFCKGNYDGNLNLLYGGSVNEENFKEIIKLKNINGLLVGRSSLNPELFANMSNS